MDPAAAAITPEMQLAQSLLTQGNSAAPASPLQALARVAQTAAGGYLQRSATSDLAKLYAGVPDSLSRVFPPGTPIGDMLASENPLVRMMGARSAEKAALVSSEPYTTHAGETRRQGANTIVEDTNPQSNAGKTIQDAARLQASGNPDAANALTSTVRKEAQIGETGVTPPPIPLNGPRLSAAPVPPMGLRIAPPSLQPQVPAPTPDQMSAAKEKLGQKLQKVADAGITNPTATGLTDVPAQIAASKGMQKDAENTAAANAKYYDSLHKGLSGSAMISAQQKQNLDVLRQVAASPNFVPGTGSDAALQLQRMAAQFGIKTEGAAPREIFNQVAARVLADQFSGIKSMASETGEQGGRIFKPMLDLEEKANITPEDSLAGIKAKIDLLDRAGNLMMKWGDKADDYIKEHGRLDAGFDKQLRADIAAARVPDVVPKAAEKASASPAKAGAAAPHQDPAVRYKQLVSGGMTKEQAFAKMHAEGY
jgi:hypothetical protein